MPHGCVAPTDSLIVPPKPNSYNCAYCEAQSMVKTDLFVLVAMGKVLGTGYHHFKVSTNNALIPLSSVPISLVAFSRSSTFSTFAGSNLGRI